MEGISPERFQTYRNAANGNDVDALRLYMWNAAVAARFAGPLHLLEVTLRNAVHDRMTERYGLAWYDLNHLFGSEHSAIVEAKNYLIRRGEIATPGKVVAEVSFRFWVGLFARKYHSLWKSDLGRLFSPRLTQSELHNDLDRLRTLRNRIAHHEPLIHRNLMNDFQRIASITTALSPAMGDWLRWHERAVVVLGTPPSEVDSF